VEKSELTVGDDEHVIGNDELSVGDGEVALSEVAEGGRRRNPRRLYDVMKREEFSD